MIPSKSLVFQANTVGAGPERKNIDSNLVGGSGVATPIGLPDWSPTITLLNGVAQGATEVTRVGRKDYNDEDYNELECYDAICSSWGGSP